MPAAKRMAASENFIVYFKVIDWRVKKVGMPLHDSTFALLYRHMAKLMCLERGPVNWLLRRACFGSSRLRVLFPRR